MSSTKEKNTKEIEIFGIISQAFFCFYFLFFVLERFGFKRVNSTFEENCI
jgi:uncharacterized protein with PQ loop repeat